MNTINHASLRISSHPIIMKVLSFCLLLFVIAAAKQKEKISIAAPSPLSDYSSTWDDRKFLQCNTARDVKYMTATEKDVIYILNMARMDPVLFANTVVKQYPAKKNYPLLATSNYYKSLMVTLIRTKALNLLMPDSLCYSSALCHATNSGKEGYVGHDRSNKDCPVHFNGECCDYGHNNALDIIMSFLIDSNVSSLGHRKICLGNYVKIGVSIQPHLFYTYTAVLDFYSN